MNEIIQQRLDASRAANAIEEEQALREIIQEVALYALWRGVSPNLPLLSNALMQAGPWAGQNIGADMQWLKVALGEKIGRIDWREASADVAPFLRSLEQESLKLWTEHFFKDRLERLASGFR